MFHKANIQSDGGVSLFEYQHIFLLILNNIYSMLKMNNGNAVLTFAVKQSYTRRLLGSMFAHRKQSDTYEKGVSYS